MKKNLFKIFTVIVFATIAGYNLYNSQKTDMMSDLALENIEALAQNENKGGFDCCDSCTGAYCGIFIDTKGNGTKLYYNK